MLQLKCTILNVWQLNATIQAKDSCFSMPTFIAPTGCLGWLPAKAVCSAFELG